MWEHIYNRGDIKSRYPGLDSFEMEMKSKVGPLSVQAPLAERLDGIKEYFDDIPSEKVSDRAIELTKSQFSSIRGIRLRSRSRTIEKMKLSTNSGSPFFTKRRLVVNKPVTGYKECAVLG